jgi:hypothetical protein
VEVQVNIFLIYPLGEKVGQFHVPATLSPPQKKQASVPRCGRLNGRELLINRCGQQNEKNWWKIYKSIKVSNVGRDSSVGIATRYGLDGPCIECWWGRVFPHPSRLALGSPSLLYNGYQVFPGIIVIRSWRWPPSPSSVEVKERVKRYLYF